MQLASLTQAMTDTAVEADGAMVVDSPAPVADHPAALRLLLGAVAQRTSGTSVAAVGRSVAHGGPMPWMTNHTRARMSGTAPVLPSCPGRRIPVLAQPLQAVATLHPLRCQRRRGSRLPASDTAAQKSNEPTPSIHELRCSQVIDTFSDVGQPCPSHIVTAVGRLWTAVIRVLVAGKALRPQAFIRNMPMPPADG